MMGTRMYQQGCLWHPTLLRDSAQVPGCELHIAGSRNTIRSGADGLLVYPEDVAALVCALHSFVSDRDRRGAFGRAARMRVEECYSLDREVLAHEHFYERVLGRGTMADIA